MTSKSPPVWRPYISNGPVAERLDEFPDALRDTTVYPWEETDADRVTWIDGTPLGDFPSRTLLAHRRLLEKKNGAQGHYFDELILAIDDVLAARQGE